MCPRWILHYSTLNRKFFKRDDKAWNLASKLFLVAFFNISVFMVQVSRWHNFSPAMKKKSQSPTGIKREKREKVKLVLALPWSFYANCTANRPLKAEKSSRDLWSNSWKQISLIWGRWILQISSSIKNVIFPQIYMRKTWVLRARVSQGHIFTDIFKAQWIC